MMHTLAMLLRRWRVHAYLDLMWVTRDFKVCLTWVVADIIRNLAGVTAVFLLAERFDGIGVWSRDQIVFLLGYTTLVRGLLDMFFQFNVLEISRRIGRGQLDHTLIQPQPVWMVLLTEGFMPLSGCLPVFAGAGIMAWSLGQLGIPSSLGWWLWLTCYVAASCALVMALTFLWGSLAFWSPVGAEEASSNATRLVFGLSMFPLDGLGPLALGTLLTVMPVGFVAWYPCQTLLGIADNNLVTPPLVAMLACLVALWAFRKGLRQYGRTGSQRYSRFGHRN
jgi:ABC-2 type transport system permease protein